MKQLLFISLLVVFAHLGYAENIQKLSVMGDSTIYKTADKLTISMGIETYDREVKKAIGSNAEKMDRIRKTLLQIGLTERELQTKSYTVSPRYTPIPQNPPANWEPAIIGYEVSNTLEIVTIKLDQAGDIIDVGSNAGANHINSINFSLQDEHLAKSEAIIQAYRRAAAYAETIAKEANLKLVSIADLTINNSAANIPMFREAVSNFSGREISTSISPRDVEVSANVSVVYYIESNSEQKKF